jgi:hypothetical protein
MSTAPGPLTPDAVDELLSAELDGDLDAAARALGLSTSEALAQLAATPGIDARRRALTRARDLIAARAPLELPIEDRLIRTAMAQDDLSLVRARRDRRDRQWRVLVAVGSVAAAVAVVVGVGVGLSTTQQGASSKAALSSPTIVRGDANAAEGSQGRQPQRVNFGDVTRDAALRTPALRQLSQLLKPGASDVTSQKSATDVPGRPRDDTGAPATAQGPNEFGLAGSGCAAAVRQRYGIAAQPAIVGTGAVEGAPVEILIFDGPTGPVAYVVSTADCSLVRKQTLG